MGELVVVDAHKVEIVPAWEAGMHDPPMQDWLQLPVSREDEHGRHSCPFCDSTHWGAKNARGYFMVYRCHDEKMIGCRAEFRMEVTPQMIGDILDALNGRPRRFGMGPVKTSGGCCNEMS